MKEYKYKNRSNKPFILTVFYLLLLVLLITLVRITQEKEQNMRLISIKQGSKKIKYFKEVDGELINIDKVALEKLMNKYNLVLEELPNEKWI